MTILEFIFRVYRSATTQCRTQEIYQTHGQQPAVPTTCGRLLRADRHRRQVRAIFLAEVIICSRHDERHLRPEEIMMMLQTLLLTFCGTAYFSAASTLVGARLLLGKKKKRNTRPWSTLPLSCRCRRSTCGRGLGQILFEVHFRHVNCFCILLHPGW